MKDSVTTRIRQSNLRMIMDAMCRDYWRACEEGLLYEWVAAMNATIEYFGTPDEEPVCQIFVKPDVLEMLNGKPN